LSKTLKTSINRLKKSVLSQNNTHAGRKTVMAKSNSRNKQRKELFDRQYEDDERRDALIEQLESKLNQKTEVDDLFIIRWRL